MLGQAEMSSYRDHNVIWTLGRYPLTDGTGNLGAESRPNCDLDHVWGLPVCRDLCHIAGRDGSTDSVGGYSASVRVADSGIAH